MIAAIAAAVIGLGSRPAALVGPSPAAYSDWLAQKTIAFDGQMTGHPCAAAVVTSLGGGEDNSLAGIRADFVDMSMEHLRIEGCGHVRLPNILAIRTSAGDWRAVGLLDGQSIASPKLQLDAMPKAQTLLKNGAHCGPQEAASSLRLGEVTVAAPRDKQGTWTELWPATVCGERVDLSVRFSSDPLSGGTVFQVRRTTGGEVEAAP